MCNAKFHVALCAFNILIHTFNKQIFALNTAQQIRILYEKTGQMGTLIYIWAG
jgi:hypothetical protein